MTGLQRPSALKPHELEDALLEWGQRRALPDGSGEAIRHAALVRAHEPQSCLLVGEELTPDWWARFAHDLRVIVQDSLELERSLADCRILPMVH